MIKAIETIYSGYRFRSRLEARWGVFFDTLGVKWEYEKEGFDLDGLWYLPDFWLPELECWIEIKGQEPDEKEMEKAFLLAWKSERPVFLFFGNISLPSDRSCWSIQFGRYHLFTLVHENAHACVIDKEGDYTELKPILESLDVCLSVRTPTLNNLLIDADDIARALVRESGVSDVSVETKIQLVDKRMIWTECPHCNMLGITELGRSTMLQCGCSQKHHCTENFEYNAMSPRLVTAYTAARQARFEHGENGNKRA